MSNFSFLTLFLPLRRRGFVSMFEVEPSIFPAGVGVGVFVLSVFFAFLGGERGMDRDGLSVSKSDVFIWMSGGGVSGAFFQGGSVCLQGGPGWIGGAF